MVKTVQIQSRHKNFLKWLRNNIIRLFNIWSPYGRHNGCKQYNMIKISTPIIIEHNDNYITVTTVHALTSIFFLIYERDFLCIFNYLWTLIPHCGTFHKVNQGFKKSQNTIYKEAYCWASLLTGYLVIIFENTSKSVHNAVYTFQFCLPLNRVFTSNTFHTKRIFAYLLIFAFCYIEIGNGKEV